EWTPSSHHYGVGRHDAVSSSLAAEQGEERLVDAQAVRSRERPNDAFAGVAGPLEHALGGDVADVHVRRDSLDAEGEGVLGEHARDACAYAAATGGRKDPVSDLDDRALGVEVMQRAAAHDLARCRVHGCKR